MYVSSMDMMINVKKRNIDRHKTLKEGGNEETVTKLTLDYYVLSSSFLET